MSDIYEGTNYNESTDYNTNPTVSDNNINTETAAASDIIADSTVNSVNGSAGRTDGAGFENINTSAGNYEVREIHRFDPYTGEPVSDFTYGSGAPMQQDDVPVSSYVRSAYGTTYRSAETAKKTKKHLPGWLKVVFSAVAFGVIAAGVFIGTNLLYDNLKPSTDVPTVNEDTARNFKTGDSTQNNSDIVATPVKNGSTDGTIASTDLVNAGDVNYTDVSAVVENSMPAIVQINCTFNTQSFFGTYQSSGAGSGIIIKQTDTELLIATNNHVVENATSIEVTFNDDSKASAYTKGTDAYADLAVVAVDLESLDDDTLAAIKVAALGDSTQVKVGQMAIAIGNALGYGTSTTVGYISATEREVDVDGKTMTLLQTDAAINPGNSGGALLNIKGEVIGINSVKYASSSVEGMGFAIPISRAIDILENLGNREVLKDSEKGYMGISMKTVSSEFAEAYNWPTGIYVSEVFEDTPAEKAGILSGDIITAINGITVMTQTDLANEIAANKAGTTVTVTLQRLSRGRFKEITVEVTLAARADYIKDE